MRVCVIVALFIGQFTGGGACGAVPRQFQEFVLDNMRKSGASAAQITSQKEVFKAQEAGASVTTWPGWTNYYNAVVFDPPVRFDMRDPFDVRDPLRSDFTDPISACQSYLRAAYRGDGKTLLKYADATGTDRLRLFVKDENATNKSYHAFSNRLTHVALLLAAKTVLSGKEYVMILWRGQNAEKPTEGPILLQKTFFVRDGKVYRLTDDLSHSSMAGVLTAARADGFGIWKFPDFKAKMSQSDFPHHFYDVK